MHCIHAPKTIHPGQLVAPSKGGSYTHQYTSAAAQAHSAPPTGQWSTGDGMHAAPDASNLFVRTGPPATHQGKVCPPQVMHGAAPPGQLAPGVPNLLQTVVRYPPRYSSSQPQTVRVGT